MRKLGSKLLKLTGFILIVLSLTLLSQRYNPKRIAFENYQTPSKNICKENSQSPISIKIPSLNVNLPIVPAGIKNGKWDMTGKGVSFLTSSVIPGETGNSILYGHNYKNLLGNLKKIKPGQTIEIEYASGIKQIFIVQVMASVSPDQTNVLKQTHDKRITLYTCDGFLDSKRFVVVATLENQTLTQKH